MQHFLGEVGDYVGLDTEFKMPERKLCLVQISTQTKCLLIRTHKMRKVPESLAKFLLDEKVMKAQVGIFQDKRVLFDAFKVCSRGFVELSYIAKKVHRFSSGEPGLKELALKFLSLNLSKEENLYMADWEGKNLSPDQRHYAACDAYVAFLLMKHFLGNFNPKNLSARDFCEESVHFIEKSFYNKLIRREEKKYEMVRSLAEKKKKERRNHPAKTLISENVRALTPEGKLLCLLSQQKANYYLRNNLASRVWGESDTIQLKFQPADVSTPNSGFFCQQKEEL